MILKNLKIKDYFELLKKIFKLNRTHNGPETFEAYKILTKYYKDSRLLYFKKNTKIDRF